MCTLPSFSARGFHGEITRRKELAGLILTEIVYPPHFQIPPHVDELPWFGFILQGSVTETFRKRSVDLATHSLNYRSAQEVHSDQFHGSGGHCLLMEMKPCWTDELSIKISDSCWSPQSAGGRLAIIGIKLYQEFQNLDAASDLAIESLALELIVTVTRLSTAAEGVPPLWLQRIRVIVHERFCESLTLPELAGSVGIHPTHLAREFRRWFRCSVGEYVRSLRVAFAYRKITETDAPLAEIALAAGFCDQSHFSRILKRYTGESPNRLRAFSNSPLDPSKTSSNSSRHAC